MFYHVCTREAMKSIKEMGVILPPSKVKTLISKGKVSEKVLGFSYKGENISYFPDHVSMIQSINHLEGLT